LLYNIKTYGHLKFVENMNILFEKNKDSWSFKWQQDNNWE